MDWSNRRVVCSSILRFGAVVDFFQLPLVGISGRNAVPVEAQARIMCIKCARRFHDTHAAARCNAHFEGKVMYRWQGF